jgi:hypothetical protein
MANVLRRFRQSLGPGHRAHRRSCPRPRRRCPLSPDAAPPTRMVLAAQVTRSADCWDTRSESRGETVSSGAICTSSRSSSRAAALVRRPGRCPDGLPRLALAWGERDPVPRGPSRPRWRLRACPWDLRRHQRHRRPTGPAPVWRGCCWRQTPPTIRPVASSTAPRPSRDAGPGRALMDNSSKDVARSGVTLVGQGRPRGLSPGCRIAGRGRVGTERCSRRAAWLVASGPPVPGLVGRR